MESNYIAGHLPPARGAKKSADLNLRSPDGYNNDNAGVGRLDPVLELDQFNFDWAMAPDSWVLLSCFDFCFFLFLDFLPMALFSTRGPSPPV